MNGQPTVYVSSTFEDLQVERRRVLAVVSAHEAAALAMEHYGAYDTEPLKKCIADVQRSDLFVGIIGWQPGSRPPGSTLSYAEHEFDAATEVGIPRLMYLASDKVRTGSCDDSTLSFRARISQSSLMRRLFDTEADLATFVATDLARELQAVRARRGPRPKLLPYLCDREPQTSAVTAEVATANEGGPPICLIYGNSEQAPLKYLDCLQRIHLPDLLREERGRTLELTLPWPSAERVAAACAIQRSLATRLGLDVRTKPELLEEQIRAKVVDHPGPVLITLLAPHEELAKRQTAALEGVVAYFQAWPRRRPRKPDLVIICLDYPAYVPNVFGTLGLSPSKRRRDGLLSVVTSLGASGSVRVLPELENVRKNEALEWTRRAELRLFGDEADLEQGIAQIYLEGDALPMAELAPRLFELLNGPADRRRS